MLNTFPENELTFEVQTDISLAGIGSSEVTLFQNPDPDGNPVIHAYDLDPGTADNIQVGFKNNVTGTFIPMKTVTAKDHEAGYRLFVGDPGWHVAAKATDAAAGFLSHVAVTGGIRRS